MMLRRWVGLIVLVVGLMVGNNLGGLPESATAQSPQITAIAWSPDGASVAVGYLDGRLHIYNGLSGALEFDLIGHQKAIVTLAWHPNNPQLVSGGASELMVWNTDTGQRTTDITDAGYVLGVAWNQDLSRLMIYRGETIDAEVLQVRNATTFDVIEMKKDYFAADFAWDIGRNRRVASGETTIQSRNPVDLALLAIGGQFSPTAIAVSPGGQRAISGNPFGSLRVWSLASLVQGGTIPQFSPPLALRNRDDANLDFPESYMWAVTFSLSGNRVYSVSGSGEFAAWDANEGGMISSTQLPDAPITAAAFNQLGTQLAYGDTNGILHLVDVATLIAPEILGDSIALFRVSDGQATLINLPPNADPNTPTADNIITYDTGAPDSANHGQWVMGDWDGDGVATPGVYALDGAFYYTNGLGPSSSWATTDLGLLGGSVVVGRFGEGERDGIGIVTGATFTTTRDLTGSTSPSVQMLAIEFAADADLQYGAGDFDGDGEDSIVIRQGDQIFYSNTPPHVATAAFESPLESIAPEDGPSQLVVGDWDADGVDSIGLYFVETGHFYGRNQTDGPLMVQQLESGAVGTVNINAMSWRFR